MGHDETAVIDERTATEPTSPTTGRRRRQLAVAAAVAVVAVGAVAWSTVDGNPATAERSDAAATAPSHGSSAASSAAASPTATTVPPETETSHGGASAGTTAPAAGPSTAQQAAPPPAGWEPRTFQGLTFAVPPGAVAPDVQDPGNADVPANFVWTGPDLGNGANAQISVRIYPADQAPTLGAEYQSITVPGADQGHMRTGDIDSQPPMTAVDVHILAGGRFINVAGMFASGPAGQQMVRDLVAALRVG